MHYGKCCIYLYRRKKSTEILTTENVSFKKTLRFEEKLRYGLHKAKKQLRVSRRGDCQDFFSFCVRLYLYLFMNWVLFLLSVNTINLLMSFILETKSQFARDDPAFLVLLVVCLCGLFSLLLRFFFIYKIYLFSP